MLATVLSGTAGAGQHFHGGLVTYTKAMKSQVLGVDDEILKNVMADAMKQLLRLLEEQRSAA